MTYEGADRRTRPSEDVLAVIQSVRRLIWQVTALVAVGMLLAVVAAINLHDQHVERCGPAHRPTSRSVQRWCNLTFPFHDHPLATTTTTSTVKSAP